MNLYNKSKISTPHNCETTCFHKSQQQTTEDLKGPLFLSVGTWHITNNMASVKTALCRNRFGCVDLAGYRETSSLSTVFWRLCFYPKLMTKDRASWGFRCPQSRSCAWLTANTLSVLQNPIWVNRYILALCIWNNTSTNVTLLLFKKQCQEFQCKKWGVFPGRTGERRGR